MASSRPALRMLWSKYGRLLEKSLVASASNNHSIHISSCDQRPPYGYSNNVNVERLRNKDKQFFTPGPLDPEIQDPSDYKIDKKLLFSTGPQRVTQSVKESMVLDVAARDPQFLKTVQFIRNKLLEIGGVPEVDYSSILLSANGPTTLESVLQTVIPREGGKVLVLENGSDGELLSDICHRAGRYHVHVVNFPEDTPINLDKVRSILESDDTYTNVVMVHCEPSSGVVNPAEEIGKLIYFYAPRATFVVDGALSFGAIPLDLEEGHIDFLVGNAHGCLESVPGISFVLAKNDVLLKCKGNCPSHTLDLVRPWEKQNESGQMRYVPNTQSVLALAKAIMEFEEEGGVEGRARRYKKNNKVLREGLAKVGFQEYLPEHGGFMVTSFLLPKVGNFNFDDFSRMLYERGVVIYQGRGRQHDVFRISNIGQINPHDVRFLLRQVEEIFKEMGVVLPPCYIDD